MQTNLEYNTIVIGASIAGSVSAYLLGQASKRTLILEPRSFPRQKPCGEGLSQVGYEYLKALGLWGSALEQSAYPFNGYSIILQSGEILSLEGDTPQGYGVSRLMLDSHVQYMALNQPTVELWNQKACAIHKCSHGWLVSTSNGETVQAKHLILANGVAAEKLLPPCGYSSSTRKRYGLAFWCEGKWVNGLPNTVQIFHEPEGQYIITPLSKGRINFSLLLNRRSSEHLNTSGMVEKAKRIAAIAGFQIISHTKPLGAAGIHHVQMTGHQQELFVVGDALERIDPIGGMGMTHALFCAEKCVSTIIRTDAGELNQSQGLRDFYRKREQGARVLRLLTQLSSGLNRSNSPFAQAAVRFAPRASLGCMSFLKRLFPRSYGLAHFQTKTRPADCTPLICTPKTLGLQENQI